MKNIFTASQGFGGEDAKEERNKRGSVGGFAFMP